MNRVLFESKQTIITLVGTDPRAVHLRTVLRVQPGDAVRVGVINGPTGTAVVQSTDSQTITLRAQWDETVPQWLPLTLLIGHPRPPVLRRILVDAASIGVCAVHVFHATLGERSYFQSSLWQELPEVLREGAMQGGNTAVPEVFAHRTLDNALSQIAKHSLRYFGACAADVVGPPPPVVLTAALQDAIASDAPVALAIGSDRGWVAAECEVLLKAGFKPLTLGPAALRTEAAAVTLSVALWAAIRQRPAFAIATTEDSVYTGSIQGDRL